MSVIELDSFEDLLGSITSGGRKSHPLELSFVRDINAADLLLLLDRPSVAAEVKSLQKLRSSHHQVAQLLSSGVAEAEIGLITGYCSSRISILKADPTFKELLAYYAAQKEEIFLDVHQRLKSFALDVLEELQERLQEKPEKFTNRELNEVLNSTMDRAGYGPKSIIKHEDGFGLSDMLDLIKKEISNKQIGQIKTIEGSITQGHQSAPVGAEADVSSTLHQAPPLAGIAGAGEDL